MFFERMLQLQLLLHIIKINKIIIGKTGSILHIGPGVKPWTFYPQPLNRLHLNAVNILADLFSKFENCLLIGDRAKPIHLGATPSWLVLRRHPL